MSNYIVNGVVIATQPTEEPVSLTEFREYKKIVGSGDDTKITRILASCRRQCELYTGRKFINTTLEFWLDNIKKEQSNYDELIKSYITDSYFNLTAIDLPHKPASSITSIKLYDLDNTESTYSSDNYFLDVASSRVIFNNDADSPTNLRARNAAKVTYVCGYGANAKDVPDDIRWAIIELADSVYNSSRISEDRLTQGFMPTVAKELLQKYKIMTTAI